MKPDTERHRALARRLFGAAESRKAGDIAVAVADLFERLNPELANLVGRVGIRALEGRAIRLARQEFPVLEGVQVGQNGDPAIVGLTRLAEEIERDEYEKAVVGLVAHLLELLSSLMGDEITTRLLHRCCADLVEGTLLQEAPGEME